MNKDFLLAAGLLAGTIIGAGIFSLPYIFSRLGIANGFFYLLAFVIVYFVIHMMYARVLQIQTGEHQFFYLAKNYLPKPFANFASLAILGELIFVLTVYLILAPTFIQVVFGFSANIAFLGLLAFWFLGSIFMFVKLDWLGWAEFLGAISVLGIVAVIFFSSANLSLKIPLFKNLDWQTFFLPFGPLLFALSGRPALHKVIEEYRKAKKENKDFPLRKAVFWGTLIPAVVYLLFVVGVLRLNPAVTPEALDSLGFLPFALFVLLGVLGLITLWTSYFMIGINVKDILKLDLKYPRWIATTVALFVPLLLYFCGLRNFLPVLSFTGGIFLGLEGVFVISIWRKAFPEHKWRWFSWPLYAVFVTAIGYEVASFL